jgi:hypothetical protein
MAMKRIYLQPRNEVFSLSISKTMLTVASCDIDEVGWGDEDVDEELF